MTQSRGPRKQAVSLPLEDRPANRMPETYELVTDWIHREHAIGAAGKYLQFIHRRAAVFHWTDGDALRDLDLPQLHDISRFAGIQADLISRARSPGYTTTRSGVDPDASLRWQIGSQIRPLMLPGSLACQSLQTVVAKNRIGQTAAMAGRLACQSVSRW